MSNSYLIELERLRAELVTILDNKGISVESDEPLNTLIPKVNSCGLDELGNMLAGTGTAINDTEGKITSINNNLFRNASNSATALYLTNCSKIVGNALQQVSNLKTVTILSPSILIEQSAFYQCSNLTDARITGLVTTYTQVFMNCTALKNAEYGTIVAMDYGNFNSCSNLQKFKMAGGVLNMRVTFNNCTSLKLIDCGLLTSFSNNYTDGLNGCSSLKAFVVRSTTVPTLNTSGIFTAWQTGNNPEFKIFVPYSKVADYQSASQWSNVSTYIKSIQENLATLIPIDFDYEDYVEIVTALPTTNIDDTKVYWIETATEGTYEQWFYGSGSWVQLADITL